MWKLPSIFASGALFQADASVTVRGETCPQATVWGRIYTADGVFSEAQAVADDTGVFRVTLTTPSASFSPCVVELSDGETVHRMEDVLFGELWLTSGQSNMEMTNSFIPGSQELFDRVVAQKVRVYTVDYIPCCDTVGFPWEPDPWMSGRWIFPDDRAGLDQVSACGLMFTAELYDFLQQNRQVPVGFLNASWGGTPITAWFPRDEVEADPVMTERLERAGRYPKLQAWNTRGFCNHEQTTCQYNTKIAPLEGVRVRGLLWYQGETDCSVEYDRRDYAEYLRFYYRIYRERFAAFPEDFRMLSVLIYPWTYGPSGECYLGYLNQAFIDTATESPDRFGYIPIGDLEPVWAVGSNHPIHPAHKYAVGRRLARLAIASVYGGGEQTAPAFLLSCEPQGARLRLRFASVGTGLYVAGPRTIGLYVAGEDGRYFPAECQVTGPDTLEVWCDSVSDPVYTAYGVLSLEVCCNLFAGEYPVTPFYTETDRPLRIEARPWYDMTRTTVWGCRTMEEQAWDLFYRPVWNGVGDSELCTDTAFCREEAASLRVASAGAELGCFVRSYPYNRLDLQNYDGLTVDVFNADGVEAELVLSTEDGEQRFPLYRVEELGYGWGRYRALWQEITPQEIQMMAFRFRQGERNYRFVNLERVRLF